MKNKKTGLTWAFIALLILWNFIVQGNVTSLVWSCALIAVIIIKWDGIAPVLTRYTERVMNTFGIPSGASGTSSDPDQSVLLSVGIKGSIALAMFSAVIMAKDIIFAILTKLMPNGIVFLFPTATLMGSLWFLIPLCLLLVGEWIITEVYKRSTNPAVGLTALILTAVASIMLVFANLSFRGFLLYFPAIVLLWWDKLEILINLKGLTKAP